MAINQESLRVRILDLLNEKPRACALTTQEWALSPEGMQKLSTLCYGIGLPLSKMLMDWISSEVWSDIECLEPNTKQIPSIFQEFIQNSAIYNITWEENDFDDVDPFSCIRKLNTSEAIQIVNQFEVSEWGLIQAYWNQNECMSFFQKLEPKQRRAIAVSIEKMKKIPIQSLKETAKSFAKRVKLSLQTLKDEAETTHDTFVPKAEKVTVEVVADTIQANKNFKQHKNNLKDILKKEKEIEQAFSEMISDLDESIEYKVRKILEVDDEGGMNA